MAGRKVLALDLATHTGWAVDATDPLRSAPFTGTFRLPKPSEEDDFGGRYVALEKWLDDMLAVHAPAVVAFEAPMVSGGIMSASTSRLLIGLAAVAELVAARAGLLVLEDMPQSVRKHFCGSGHAKKHEVMARCDALGWNVQDDNAADAAAVWSFAKFRLSTPAERAAAFRLQATS